MPQANPTTPPRRQREPSPSTPGDNKRQSLRLKAGEQALAVNTWLGFVVHPNIPMAANKHILVMEVLQTMVEGQAMHSKDIEKALGCMSAGEVDASASLGWRSCCGSSSTRPSSSTPLTCRSPLGGVAAMLAPRTKDWHLWEDGAPTKWSQKRRRCTGSTSRSTWKSTRGHSRMGIPSGGLWLWKCWAHAPRPSVLPGPTPGGQ